MRWPRMTVRRLAIVVAVVALAMGAFRLTRANAYHARMAHYNKRNVELYEMVEQGWKDRLATLDPMDPAQAPQTAEAQRSIRDASVMREVFAKRRRISERMASHPWESPPPDPLDRPAGPEPPVLIVEPRPGLVYEFSSGSIAGAAFALVAGVAGWVAFRLARRRLRQADEGGPTPDYLA